MTEHKKFPSVRFKGFTDNWKQRRFFDFAKRDSVFRTSSSEYPSVEYEDVVAEEGQLNKDVRLKNTQKTGIVFDGGQVLYGKLRPYLHNWLNPDFTGVAVGDWWVLQPVEVDKNFLYRLIQTQHFDEVANQSSGSKMPRADWNLVSNTEFVIPSSLDEQMQIAEIFVYCDNLITNYQRKYNKLLNVKKAMLEKMFPKEGEKVPEIRFNGCTGNWEQCKLGEAVSLRGRIGFRGYKETDLVSAGNGAITFSPADIDEMGNVSLESNKYLSWAKYDESPEIQVKVGDILFTKTASIGKVGFVRELKEKATINPQFALLTPKGSFNGYFTFLSVRNDDFMNKVRGITGGSSVPTMSQEKLKRLTFLSPHVSEQNKIGEFFRNLDNLITLQKRKIEKLKNIKKSMLEKMFV